MSAYLVNDDTLDLLSSFIASWGSSAHESGVRFYLEEGVLPPRTEGIEVEVTSHGRYVSIANTQARLVKAELLSENIASLWGRYPAGRDLASAESMIGERSAYRFVSSEDASLAEVAGALHCYEYQSCETDEWNKSFAYALCQAARRKITSHLMNQGEGNWEFNREARRQAALKKLGRV
jgi:hypothetical protein